MPWENNAGGGKGGGNNAGGPWGQGPGGPKRPTGGGGGTPNLEEILRQGRERFRGGLPSSGLPGGRWAIVGGVVLLVGFWLLQSVYTVEPQEVGVELQFGKPKPELSQPGLHFHLWPIEAVEKVTITENQTQIGSTAGARGQNTDGLMLTGDQNIVDVRFSVLWQVSDPAAYLFNVANQEEMVRSAAESAMREVVGRSLAANIFRSERAGTEIEVLQITQAILDTYSLGVTIARIAIENVAPPTEVADAFDEVQRALQDEDRVQEEARQYANTLLGQVRGEAAGLRETAAAYKDQVVKEAEGQAARFVSIYTEYKAAPEVTRKRLYLETMEVVLGNSQKIIVEEGANGSGVVPYLPLPGLASTPPATQPK
ncbi:MAG: HflK protein [Devosia sp.]|nr:HflK protein [Devosia sp.]